MDTKIKLLLVSQNPLIRDLLSAVLEDEADISLIGRLSSQEALLDSAPEADVILLNPHLSPGEFNELVRTLQEKHVSAELLVLGLSASLQDVLGFVKAGAAGYALQSDSLQDLLKRIRSVYNQRATSAPQLGATMKSRLEHYDRLLEHIRSQKEQRSEGNDPDSQPGAQ